jgi:hypothetical protein
MTMSDYVKFTGLLDAGTDDREKSDAQLVG